MGAMGASRTPGSGSVFAALLAGGRGTRFWPASREARPKQFLKLLDERTLLRATWERFAASIPPENILVVASAAHADRIRQELPELQAANLILEPCGRDTAAAAVLAARAVSERDPEGTLVLAPTDHALADESRFRASLDLAIAEAGTGALVVFGVPPSGPSSSYGYIEVGVPIEGSGAADVARFVEKPDKARAEAFLATGRFYWNAGIFVWKVASFFASFQAADAALFAQFEALPPYAPPGTPAEPRFRSGWESLPAIAIDRALMEKARGVRVVLLDAGWSDVGGWEALGELLEGDADGNRTGEATLYLDARRCAVHRSSETPSRPLIALVGTEDLVVVETPDAILILKKGSGEVMRKVVDRLRETGRDDLI